MSANTHSGTVQRDGSLLTFCGRTFPKGTFSRAWIYWGTCPKCAKAKKGRTR